MKVVNLCAWPLQASVVIEKLQSSQRLQNQALQLATAISALNLAPSFEGFTQGHGVGVFEIAAHGQATGDAGDGNAKRLDQF